MAADAKITLAVEGAETVESAFSNLSASAKQAGVSLADAGAAAQKSGTYVSALTKYFEELTPSTQHAHGAFTDLKGTLSEMWENPTAGAKGLANALGKDLSTAMGSAGVEIGLVSAAALTAGIALYELGQHATETGAELEKVALTTNTSVGAVSDLKFAMDATGGSIDAMNAQMFMFEQRMENSSEKVDEGLHLIGLSLNQIGGMDHEQQILAISDAFRGSGENVNRAAAAMDIFGKQGRAMLPQLMQDLSGLVDKSKEIGNTWSTEDAEAAHEFEIAAKTMAAETASAWTQLGREVMPVTNEIALGYDRMKLAIANVALETAHTFQAVADESRHLLGSTGDLALATETAAARQDVINKALSLGAAEGIKFGDAVKYVNEQFGHGAAVETAAAGVEAYFRKLAEGNDKTDSTAASQHALSAALAEYGVVQGAVAGEVDHANKAWDDSVRASDRVRAAIQQIQSALEGETVHRDETITAIRRTIAAGVDDAATTARLEDAINKLHTAHGTIPPDLQLWADANRTLSGTIDTLKMGLGQLTDRVPDLTQHAREMGAVFQEDAAWLAPLTAKFYEFAGGISIAGDELDHVTIPAFSKLMDVASSGQVSAALTQSDSDAKKLGVDLEHIASAFEHIGVSSSSGLGQAVSGFVQLFRVIEQAETKYQQVVSKFGANSPQADAAGSARDTAIGYAGVGAGASIIAQQIDTGPGASTGSLVAHGALEGAAVGASIAPYAGPYAPLVVGAAAGVGAIAGWIQSGKEWRKVVNDISRDMGGIKVSEDFANMIDKLESDTGLQRVQAITTQIDQLIKMAGGLDNEFAGGAHNNFDLFFSKLHDGFSYVEQGSMTVAQMTQVMDKNFADFAAAGTDSLGRVSDHIKELIDLNQRFGTDSKAVAAWQLGQADSVVAGFSAVEAAQQGAITGYDNIKAAVDTAQAAVDQLMASGTTGKPLDAALATLAGAKTNQAAAGRLAAPELGDLGIQAVGAYETDVASGKSKADALKSESAALTALQKEYKDLGIEVTDVALKNLFMQNSMQTAAPTLMAGVAGLSKEMIGLDNLSLETADSFASQERTGEQMYTRLQASAFALGGTTKDALLPMQDWLHAAQDEAKKLGVALDPLTQQMIDQSKDAGVWQDDITPAPTVLSTLGDMKTVIEDIDRALRGLPPKTDVDVNVNTNHTDNGSTGGDGSTASTGGFVGATRIMHLAGGGPVGTDTVNAWLTPGESVLTPGATSYLGLSTIASLNSGRMGITDPGQGPGKFPIGNGLDFPEHDPTTPGPIWGPISGRPDTGDGQSAPPPWYANPDIWTSNSGGAGAMRSAPSDANGAVVGKLDDLIHATKTQQTPAGDVHLVVIRADASSTDDQIIEKVLAALPDRVRRNVPAGIQGKLKGALGQSVTTWT